MEGYEIEVVLVNATFNKKGPLNNGELPILSLEEVDPADYPEFVSLGKWVDDGELLFQPYLRAKIEDTYKNVDISIKINPHTSVKSVSTQAGDIYQKFVRDDGVIYFLPPRKWERDNPQKWPQETVVSHYVSVGSEVLQISFEGRTESMRLISGETDEYSNFYKELIQDLVSIQQQLCIDENSSISTGLIWTEALYQNTEQIIDDFCETFWKLEKDAQPELRQYKCKQSFNKVKKITQQALVEHEIFHKDKVTAIAYREVLDTFEHRVIKTHIGRLKRLISLRQNIETTALENEIFRLKSSLKFTEEELEEKFNGLNANIASKKEKLKNVLTENRPPEFRLQTVFIQIKLNKRDETGKFFEYQISKERPQISLITQKGKKNADDCQYRVKTKAGWSERQAYKTNNAKTTAFINMTLPMDCLESAALLFKYLDSSDRFNSGDFIGIRGEALPDYSDVNDKGFATFKFDFRTINGISRFKPLPDGKAGPEEKIFYTSEISPEEKESSIAAFRKYILDLFDQIIDNDDDSRGFLEENSDSHKCIKELNDKLNYEEERAKRWNVLKRKLERIDETDLLKSVSKERTPIRSSNLFSFNPLYRRIYKIMKSNNGAMDGIDYYSTDEEFRVAKLPELYEKWCCIKLVMLFVDSYGFRIKGKNGEYRNDGVLGFKNLIKDILDERESLNGTKFELESDQISEQLNRPMHVSIWYDREFRIDKEDLKKNNVFFAKYERASLRPDIFMKIDYGNKTRLFVFDAKYRGNQNYDGIKDLCEIAFQKYTKELARLKNPVSEFGIYLPSEIISGSFILHSSTQTAPDSPDPKVVEGIELKYDAKKYLGDYPDIWAEKWIKEASDKNWKVNKEKLKEWTTWKSGTNNENKLGIITCNPKSNQLAYVIQMIMEQQFRLYQSKCWICGGEVEVSPKYTEKGQLKYHIKCKKCGKFMVETHCGKSECPSHDKKSKIGKHTENYYASAKSDNEDACWNVSCPVCRQTAPNRKKTIFR